MAFSLKVDKKLMTIAKKLTKDRDLQWDLYQEMSIHLWQIKRQYSDKSEAWYLTSCRNCAIDYIKCGKASTANQDRISRWNLYILLFPVRVAISYQ